MLSINQLPPPQAAKFQGLSEPRVSLGSRDSLNEPHFLVSIIIPVYNVENYILECLQSVAMQDITEPFECILIDDKGSDSSMAVVKEFVHSYKGPNSFEIVECESNGGASCARNIGLRKARGKYVFFLDSDDILTPYCLSTLFSCAKKHPDAQIVIGDFDTFPETDMNFSRINPSQPEYVCDEIFAHKILMTAYPIVPWNKLYNRSFLIDNELYFREGIIHEDDYWRTAMYPLVHSIATVHKVTYHYRIRSNSVSFSPLQKSLDAITVIGEELFSRQTTWDRPLLFWAFNTITDLRFSDRFASKRMQADEVYNHIIGYLISNTSIPFIVRVLFRYHSLPRKFVKMRLINSLLDIFVPDKA